MSIIEVFKAVDLYDDAEKGRKIYKEILTRHKPSEPGFKIEIQNLSDVDFNYFVTYHTFQSLEVGKYMYEK